MLCSTVFLLYINDFPDDVICNIAICVDSTTLYCRCDNDTCFWQHVVLASELESKLLATADWGRSWFIDFNNLDCSNNCGGIDVKMNESVLRIVCLF